MKGVSVVRLSRIEDKRYRWIVVAACFLIAFTGLGFCSGTKALYLAPITEATGLKRSLFSLSDSCRYITTTIVNLFFGAHLARYGAKKLLAAGYLCLIAFALIYATASSAWVFCLGGVCLGLGLSWMGTAMIGHVISAWFQENRGTVMGFALAANGVGSALATQIVSPIINRPGDPFGYRKAYLLTALLLAIGGAVVLLIFREYPSGGRPAPARSRKQRGQTWSGLTAKQALRTPWFYGAVACVFVTGLCLQSTSGISAAHMRDAGLDSAFIAGVVSLHSITLSLCKLLVGWLFDRIRLRRTITLCCAAAVGSAIALLAAAPEARWPALVYGPLMSLALPMETIILPLLAASLFGEKEFEKLLGIFVSVTTAGFAVGVPLSNLCHDLLGSYRPSLIATGCAMAAVTLAYQFILTAADRKRASVEAEEAEQAAE